MGNDGGDIPRRKQLVKQKPKLEVVNSQTVARSRSRYCNLTNQKLKQPLAICRLGCIYNYENILTALIQKNLSSKYAYIRKLGDIKKIKIQRVTDESQNYFCCPITKLEYNGYNKFVAIWDCGHVFSKKALKQVAVENDTNQKSRCIICQQQYQKNNLIDLNMDSSSQQLKRSQLLKKTIKKTEDKQEKEQQLGIPQKKVKVQFPVSKIEQLDGEFRDIIRQRKKFKQLFTKKQQK